MIGCTAKVGEKTDYCIKRLYLLKCFNQLGQQDLISNNFWYFTLKKYTCKQKAWKIFYNSYEL